MIPNRAPLASRLAQKLAFYAREAAFAAQAPATASQSLHLLASTAAFHYRNWRKLPVDPGPRLTLDLDLAGVRGPVTLRPRDGDLAILYEVFVGGAYEIPPALLDPHQVGAVIDAGANIGFSALYFAARYPNARILAVEPNPDNIALLRMNTAHVPRITPVEACVTAVPSPEVYIATTGRASHFKINTKNVGVPVRGMSLDELADTHGLARIDLLKMDIEGAEREIFAEASFLPRVGVVTAELHGRYGIAQFSADIEPWGFTAWKPHPAADPALVLAARNRPDETGT
jgi:FkbM family methyltransferase